MTNTLVANEPATVRILEARTAPMRRERALERNCEEKRRTWKEWLREMAENAD